MKTNSKKVRDNVRKYIMNHFDGCNHGIEPPKTFEETAAVILSVFRAESSYSAMSEKDRFANWASGLPSILDTCYYYNRSAIDDLGSILEEVEEEKAKYSESQAESLLTWLIYRELMKGVEKV